MDSEEFSIHIPVVTEEDAENGDVGYHVCGICNTTHGFNSTLNSPGFRPRRNMCSFTAKVPNWYGYNIYIQRKNADCEPILTLSNPPDDNYIALSAIINDYLVIKRMNKKILYYMLKDNPKLYTFELPGDILYMILEYSLH